jgi:formylglycine-generating enzyme required for sulfatase activity
VRVPDGPAIMDNGRRVTFPALLADKHEVSNQQYRYCVEAQRCAPPDEPAGHAHFADGDNSLPVVYVTAYDAAQFCAWLGRRLPTEPQWERIARGTHGARYPWGNAPPVPGQANIGLGGRYPKGLVPVGDPAFRSGDSGDGVEQLIGNVQEWTATRVRPGKEPVVLLGSWNGSDRVPSLAVIGGGYQDDAASVTGSLTPGDPSAVDSETGFRCVATTD